MEKFLSFVERIYLVKSVITYQCKASTFVNLENERIKRNFLWRGGHEDSKPVCVKWANIYKAKEEGPLGVKLSYLIMLY